MKLFITNKSVLDKSVPKPKEAHQNAFSQLSKAVADGNIPIEIITKDCVFKFIQVREQVYFFEFLGDI